MKKSFMLQVKNVFAICAITLTLLFALKSESAYAQPSFIGGATQTMTVCQDSGPNDITSFLSINDLTSGSTETWTIISSTSGTLSGFSFSTTSTGFVVTPSGLSYTPPSGYSGTDVFSIQISDGTISDVTTITVTVNPFPSVTGILGADSTCMGLPVTLTDLTSGGTWATSDVTIASINTTGDITAVSVGAATISYSKTNSCGTTTVTHAFYVNDVPTVMPVSGVSNLCVGSTNTFLDATADGTWSTSAAGIASVDAATGDVTGVSAGLVNITYSVTNTCGTTSQSTAVTIEAPLTLASISGVTPLCIGSTSLFTDATSGGSWSTSASSVASVDASGNVTGVATGSATISYSATNTCGTADSLFAVTVIDVPSVAAITGTTSVCEAATITLADATTGGTWSTDAASIASVNTTGDVTGIAAGTANISYAVTNSCGTTTVSTMVTVNALPTTPAALSGGAGSVCVGASVTFTESVSGGTWSSDASGIATVNTTGDVTGVTVGTANISYTISNGCGSNSVSAALTVIDLPVVPAIGGTTTLCVGATATLTNATSGGTWTTDAASVASINSATGDMTGTGVAAGTANITYSVTNGCGTTTATLAVTVNDVPSVAAITGAAPVCVGATITLADGTSGGSWSSDDASIATVDPATGDVTGGVAAGTAYIAYDVTNSCGTTTVSTSITVNDLPSVPAIGGTTTLCIGATETLTNATSGGTWTTDAASVASIDAASGDLTGVAAGTANISYSVTNSCGTTTVSTAATVNDVPTVAAISGASSVCVAASTTLTDATTGGSWSSVTPAVASVDASSGVVTGVGSGGTTIRYAVTNACGTTTVNHIITVNPLPATPSSISAPGSVCVGATSTLTNGVGGGTWSSDASGIATIDAATGDLTGVAIGTANITYTISNSCGSNTVSAAITIDDVPSVPAIGGTTTVCEAATTTLTNATTGGTWSTDAASIASVNTTGDVTGVAAGTANITYSVTNACGAGSASTAFTVNALPATPAALGGGASTLCVGATTTFTEAVSGGTWTTDAAGIASVNATGDVTGVAIGTANITYTISNSCGSNSVSTAVAVIDVPSVPAIGGTTTVCEAATTTLTNATTGGTWSTDAASIASVNTTGDVTGVAAGTANITYSVTNACGTGSASTAVTVNALPATPAALGGGASTLCVGATTTFTESVGGGTWTTDAAGIASVNATGDVTGVAVGTANISYTISNSCGSNSVSAAITIDDIPSVPAIGGTTTVCEAATTTLTNATTGGTWSTDAASIASVNTTGDVTGVAAGTANITYSVTNACGTGSASTAVTVNALPATPAALGGGASTLCVGATITFTEAVSGGAWTTDAAGIASVNATGDVTGVAVGTANISYTISNSCGSNTVSAAITINDIPSVPAIGGTTTICEAATTTLTNATTGGTWSTDAASIASVNTTGDVTGVAAGTANITYSVTNACGTGSASTAVTVNALPATPAALGGGASTLCVGATTTFTEAVSGGAWTTDAAGIASVNATGDVTGVAVGTANISYTISNSCGSNTVSAAITIDDVPSVPAIGGTTTVCEAATTTLTNATTGGTWSTDAASIASVNTTGDVTGVAAGTANITYSVSNACGAGSASTAVTVNALPATPAALGGGASTLCVGATTTFTEAVSGGAWTTDAAGIASVNATGDVTGVAVGTANISYTVSNSCGSNTVSAAITIDDVPSVPAIGGTTTVCEAATTTLTNATTGGTWSTDAASIASVNTTGDVTGVAAGTANITYSVTNACGAGSASTAFTVNALPATPAALGGGASTLCVGATTTFTEAVSGGAWTTDAAGIASVNATGDVTGVAVGTANISYAISNSCGSNAVSAAITIDDVPSVPAIGGTTTVCEAATTTLTNATTGGTWSTDAASIASVNTTGDVTGIAAGTANITYSVSNACGAGSASTAFTVNALPATPAALGGGASTLCVGATTTFTEAVSGGAWTTDAAGIASVNATGDVTGVAVGTANISYTIANSCGSNTVSAAITIDDVPSVPAIGGVSAICVSGVSTLTNAMSGGTWSSDAVGVASVDASTGDLTGISVGTANITYTVTNACGTGSNTTAITVNTLPSVAAIGGAASVCETATITLTDATTGGTWTTDAAGTASVEAATGIVTGVAAGTANITYTVSNACGDGSSSTAITVNPAPNAGSVSGVSSLCVGTATTFTDGVSGGTWSSDATGIATVDASTGDVTGVATGIAAISYSVTNSCGTASASQSITIIDVPVAPAIGGPSTVCEAATITLTNATSGGSWTTDAAATASVDASTGVVSGIAAGTANITYSVTNACGTGSNSTSVTVDPAPATPAAIGGSSTVCVGASITLTESVTGGTWSTDAAGVASVNATGDVTGVATGSANISYTITNGCGSNSVSLAVTVDDIPSVATISGAASVCVGATTTLSDATTGGSWASDATGIASIEAATGIVTGVTNGTANITYSVSNACGTGSGSTAITVDPAPATPAAIGGPATVCVGATITLTNSVSGGSWSSDATGIASVDASTGDVFGTATGTANITYTIANGCGSNMVATAITVDDIPSVPVISGVASVCVGSTQTLSNTMTGGSWTSDAAGVATIDVSSGVYTGVTTGTANITYAVTNACGTGTNSTSVTVIDVPSVATISGAATVCETATITFTDATSGGTWSSSAAGVASVDASTGDVTGVSAGSANITYTVTNTCGSTTDVAAITVNPAPHAGTISGTLTACVGSAVTLTSTVSGGTWSTSAAGVASVDATSGSVTGVATGGATISYSFTNSCGTDVATTGFTVIDIPVVGSVTGPVDVCVGATITLGNTAAGGTWSSSASSIATVDPSTGVVTGVTAGSSTITYNVTNACGSVDSTLAITVNPAPAAGTISGLNSICTSATITLSSTVTGGTWSSDNATVATINTTGDVFGAGAGTATISYSFTNSCGTDVATFGVTVNGSPFVSPITGLDTVCAGNTVTLADATVGGTWSLTDLTVAAVDASGNVTGFFQGVDTIQYTFTATCGSTTVIFPFYVNDLPAAPSISGTTTFCAGATNAFTSTTAGGTWSSTDASVATIDAASGVATGTTGGFAIISYSVANACGTGDNAVGISVTSLPFVGAVTGVSSFCNGTSTTYSNAASGGTWATSDATVVTIDPATGVATGLAAGAATISYSVSGTCGTVDSTLAITVDALPAAGAISGPATICVSAGATLTDVVAGGTWTTSDATVASIDPSTGVVAVASIGSATISYTITNGCGSDVATYAITTDDLPTVAAITGTSTICLAGSFTFTDGTTGGLWSTTDASIASVNAGTGDVTGVAIGAATISYSVTNTCGTTDVTSALSVDPAPSAGAILGSPSACAGTTVTLTDAVAGGVWSTSDATIASVDAATGDVTGIAAGSATISYAVTNSCATAYATLTFTVDDIPVVAAISGTSFMCVGSTSTMTDATASGTWASSDPSIATIDAASGDVTGLTTGTVFISYTVVNGCGPNTALTAIFVDDLPVPTPITGGTSVCVGSTITLADAMAGGTWNTSDATVASVNAATGDVSGMAIGSAIISYSVTNGCGTTDNTIPMNVITVPSAPAAITGTPVVCVGSTTLLNDVTPGGSWSSSSIPMAAVDAAGLVSGLSTGTLTISYTLTNSCGSTSATIPFTVNDVPTVAAITGASFVCFGGSTPLNNATAGGTWTSSDATIASIGAASGVATGLASGNVTITYSVTNSCGTTNVTFPFTVTPLPVVSAVTGTSTVCAGGTFLVHNDTTGGVWSSSDNTVATIDAAGIVTGVAAGSATMTYTLTTVCGTTFATLDITVTDVPAITPVVGVATVCVGFSTIYTDPTAGGVWSTSDASVATVDTSGNVTGVGLGTATISYTVTNFCGSTYDSLVVTVSPAPVVGTITGATSVCVGSTITLADAAGSGTWSSTDLTVATVDAATGDVTGIGAGTVTISYSVTNSCGTDAATFTFTVNDVPAVPGITGVTTVCEGSTTSLGNAVAGGTWSTSDATIASIDIAGVVYGVLAGSATITYSVTNVCGTTDVTTTVTVNPLPTTSTITGASSVCVGSSVTLSDATAGGTWTSSDATIASIDATSGAVTGVSEGAVTITYTITNSCGSIDSFFAFTVNDVPIVASITGVATLCPGASGTLADATTGGTWTSSDITVASIDASTGVVTGVAGGTVAISYAVTNTCGVTTISTALTVIPVPSVGVISGTTVVCAGSSTILSDTAAGGTWTSSATGIASVDAATGVVTGVAGGTAIITYDITNACGSASDTILVTVNGTPTVGAITGTASFCVGTTTALADTTAGGTWSSADTTIATIDAAGTVTGVAGGTVNISYAVANSCGTTYVTYAVTVNPLPVIAAITGTTTVCEGSTTTLADATTGGTWTTSTASIASVDASGNVTGVAAGAATITYTVTSAFGCSAYVTTSVTVNPLPVLSPIGGPTGVALGDSITVTDTAAGGTWSTSDASIASINSTTGRVYGIAHGTVTITYTRTNAFGCTATVTTTIGVAGSLTSSFIFPGGNATLCHNNPIPLLVYTADTSNHLTYQWYRNSIAIAGATDSTYIATATGYFACAITNAAGTVTLTGITIVPPPNPVINITGGNILFTGSFATYQWMLNGVIIPGATSSVHTETAAGFYNVIVTDANGCTDTSASFVDTNFGLGFVALPDPATTVRIYPNPTTSVINIETSAGVHVNVSILSMDGKVVIRQERATAVDVSELASAMYMIMIYDQQGVLLKADRFVKNE